METRRQAPIVKITGNAVEGMIDEVASELPVRIELNGDPLVTLLCTPAELKELAIGFLLSEGILRSRSSITSVEVDESAPAVRVHLTDLPADYAKQFETRTISSGCGKGITFTASRISSGSRITAPDGMIGIEAIRSLLQRFRSLSTLYLETGGVHSAALSDGKDILFFSEDIGRHNAVDKLVGRAFLQSIPLEDKILLTSGRVTSEIVTKAGRNRFPVLISRAAPSCMAISIAEDLGITLVGFARGDRMNIYSWPKRISVK